MKTKGIDEMSSRKGSSYEREVCTLLSRWWSEGKRDDIFWRSSGSGARATVRGKKNQKTAGQCGDVCATDPCGEPLIDLLTVEIKRGYSSFSFQDLIDRQEASALQWWEKAVEQAIMSHELAGSFAWLLIVRRDRRVPLVFMPWFLSKTLIEIGVEVPDDVPEVQMRVEVRDEEKLGDWHTIVGMLLVDFLRIVRPEHVKKLAKIA